jgi:putative flippase GtrA
VRLPARLQALYDQHGEKLRFLVVGVWNTAFSIGVLWLLDHFIHYDMHSLLQKEGVLVVSWVISVTQNFFTFKLLVFRTKGNWLREYLRMYVTYAATFAVQSVLVLALSTWLGWSVFWANLPTVLIVMVMSYFGHKYFTFRNKHVIEAVDAGDVFESTSE